MKKRSKIKLISAIGTLPISPRKNAPLTFYGIPFLVYLIGKILNVKIIYAINNLGGKSTSEGVAEYLKFFQAINAEPDIVWVDSDKKNFHLLSEVLEVGLREKWIVKEMCKIYLCECGKTELLHEAENLFSDRFKRNVYRVQDEKIICKFCNTAAELIEKKCLLLYFPLKKPKIKIIPDYAKSECENLMNFLRGKKILISRSKGKKLRMNAGGDEFKIDTDFCWMIFLFALQRANFQIKILLSGHKTLKQSLFSILLTNRLGAPLPEYLVITPYRNILSRDFRHDEANALFSRFGKKVIRYFLALGLGGKRKYLTTPSELFYLIQHSVHIDFNKLKTKQMYSLNIKRLWRLYNQGKFCDIIANLRRNKFNVLSSLDKKLLQIILK